jgi:hypothetical protein
MKPFDTTRRTAALILLAGAAGAQTQLETFAGTEAFADFGSSMISISDIDGDGARDLLVAQRHSWFGGTDYSVIRFSGATLQAITADLSPMADDEFGTALADLGDHDGDGQPAWLVGAPGTDLDVGFGLPDAGRVYLMEVGAPKLVLDGDSQGGRFGASVAGVGDIDHDGVGDFAVGAPYASPGEKGEVVVFSGDSLLPIHTWNGDQTDCGFGSAVAGVGDMNGDGWPDVAIGAPGYDWLGADYGFVTVRSGLNGGQVWGSIGPSLGARLGTTVATAGDVSGDGKPDLLVGAPGEQSARGVVRLIPSPTGGSPLWTVSGLFPGDEVGGGGLQSIGDANHDGKPDVLVGVPKAFSDAGMVRLLAGGTGFPLMQFNGNGGPDWFGYEIAPLGDLDGDGWLEFAAGAPEDKVGELWSAGSIATFGAWIDQIDLGSGGPGDCHLGVRGFPLKAGGKADLTVTGAWPWGPVYLLASLGQMNAPFKGGVLVPNVAQGLLVIAAADGAGELHIPGIPGGLGLFSVYVQAIAPNGNLPAGFALSNTLKLLFQP